MHNNYFFLRQLSAALAARLQGAVISECFSQSKDELIVRFEIGRESFYLRANLLPELSCLSFPSAFQRARRNSVDLFPSIVGRKVVGTTQFRNERSFSLDLSEEHTLLFKMHGNRTNIAVVEGGRVADIFRKKLSQDFQLVPDELHRDIDWSEAAFLAARENLKATYFTFGKVIWRYLQERGFFEKTAQDQWREFSALIDTLNNPVFYITLLDGKPVLSLVKFGEVLETHSNPVDAAQAFYHAFVHDYAFSKEKKSLLTQLYARLEAGRNYCQKNELHLKALTEDDPYRQWADLIMANLHNIPAGAETVTLENFYADQRPEKIRLRKDLSPQKNAEVFYRKARNRQIEVERVQSSIRNKEEEMARWQRKIQEVEAATDLKALRALQAELRPMLAPRENESLPFFEFFHQGFRILVGKHAQGNDILTFKYGYKEDLWLHAKDVTGSHVLIKHQAGKSYPKDVIAYAASLAAYNSKRKTESLCPVIVTPRKFVRKRKGDPAGAVVVEREEVVMAEPLLPQSN